MKNILIATPCYNEELNIKAFYDSVLRVISKIKDYNFKLLFVNDGSNDSTLNEIKALTNENSFVHYLSFSRNFGKESAMKAIFDYAYQNNYNALIMMDTDLQDLPDIIPKMLSKWNEGYNHVLTKHTSRKGQLFVKKICSKAFYKMYSSLTGFKDIKSGIRDYALFDEKVIEAFKDYPATDRFIKGISEYVGFKRCVIEFDYKERTLGKTKWGFKKLFKYAVLGFNSFSEWLRIVPKIFMFIFSLLFAYDLVFAIINEVKNHQAFKIALMNILTNLSLRTSLLGFSVSIMAYVLMEVMYQAKRVSLNKPIYFIEEEDNNEKGY